MGQKLVAGLKALWNLRIHPHLGVRAIWWALLVVAFLLAVLPQEFDYALCSVWIAANVLFTGIAEVWGLLHLRTILRSRDVILKWTFWLTFLGTLAIWSWLETMGAEQYNSVLAIVPATLLIFSIAIGLFVLLLALNYAAAAIGALTGQHRSSPTQAARFGVGSWWAAALLVWFLTGIVPIHSEIVQFTFVFSVPLLTVALGALFQRPGWDPQRLGQKLLAGLGQQLIWKRGTTERVRSAFDLRGGALGLVVGGLTLIAAYTHLLRPIQTTSLMALMRAFDPIESGTRQDDNAYQEQRKRIVLLEMDDHVKHDVLTQKNQSEAALQAEAIRRLTKWGANAIVLPDPRLTAAPAQSSNGFLAATEDMPELTAADLQRSERDLVKLEAAIQAAGNVFLMGDEDSRLASVVRAVGTAELPGYNSARLPSIPTLNMRIPPIPILLASAVQGVPPTVRILEGRRDHAEIASNLLPLIERDRVLVHIRHSERNQSFPHVSYTSLLNGESIYEGGGYRRSGFRFGPFGMRAEMEPKPSKDPEWVPPQNFFRDRIVLLDRLSPSVRLTVFGPLPTTEVLAHATLTLLPGQRNLRRANPLPAALATLLIGAVVGMFCYRRDPMGAAWRTALLALMLIAASLFSFEGGVWFDPVVPLITAIGAFTLVTQFTFALEIRNRTLLRRIVAPEVADELVEVSEDALGLGGRKQVVCVLFADIRNFTRFAETHSPEEVIEVINLYMTALTERLFAYGGILDKYTGDGLMAMFRIHDDIPAGVTRAVQAALAMRDAAAQVSAQLVEQNREPLHVGIGMHYGEAVVGLVGNLDLQFNYTALGHTVVVGARLQTLAAGGEVIVSEEIFTMIGSLLCAEQGDPVQVKGMTTPVRPYRVTALQDGEPMGAGR